MSSVMKKMKTRRNMKMTRRMIMGPYVKDFLSKEKHISPSKIDAVMAMKNVGETSGPLLEREVWWTGCPVLATDMVIVLSLSANNSANMTHVRRHSASDQVIIRATSEDFHPG